MKSFPIFGTRHKEVDDTSEIPNHQTLDYGPCGGSFSCGLTPYKGKQNGKKESWWNAGWD